MAERQEVDPQYLWIMPKYFELTAEAKGPSHSGIPIPLDTSEAVRLYLNVIAEPGLSRRVTRIFMEDDIWPGNKQEWTDFCSVNNFCTLEYCFVLYIFHQTCLKILDEIDLDFRGGLHGYWRLRDQCRTQKTQFTTSALLVKDAEKAKKYVNIGIKLDSATPKHPSTLEEAAEIYAKISTLVGNNTTIKDIEKQITETKDDNELWELKREKFRLEIKERYREMLIDMAHEERLENQLDSLRAKKRVRSSAD